MSPADRPDAGPVADPGSTAARVVLAALDNSAAAGPVLRTATALAEGLGAEVRALHVRGDGDRTARSVAEAAGVAFEERRGGVVAQLRAAAAEPGVRLLVLGARGRPTSTRAGHVALALVEDPPVPLALVPPDARVATPIRRVLVALEASVARREALAEAVEVVDGPDREVVVLHVDDEATLPVVSDQPQHETAAYATEFVARYCPPGLSPVRLELRVGDPTRELLAAVDELAVDAVALGCPRSLAPGRAAVVRGVIAASPVPVLLVPLPLHP